MKSFTEELFVPGTEKVRKTRREKRDNRQRFQAGLQKKHPLDINSDKFKTLQKHDPSLSAIRDAARGCPSSAGVGFFEKDGLVYRRWKALKNNTEALNVEQLVLPRECREEVLRIAHDIPMAGHLGKEKTVNRILQRFYWPTLYHDVSEYCRRCGTCQKSSQPRVRRAPLIPLPIIAEPFK